MAIETNLADVKELLKEFSDLDAFIISMAATRRAGARVRTRVRQYVPVDSGELKKNIRLKIVGYRRAKEFRAVVYNRIGYYATLLHGKRKEHKRRGFTVAEANVRNPSGNWFDKAVQNHATEFEQVIAKALQDEMRKSARRVYMRSVATAARLTKTIKRNR